MPTLPSGSSTLYFLPKTFPIIISPLSAIILAPFSILYLVSKGLTNLKLPLVRCMFVLYSCVHEGLVILPCIIIEPSYVRFPAIKFPLIDRTPFAFLSSSISPRVFDPNNLVAVKFDLFKAAAHSSAVFISFDSC